MNIRVYFDQGQGETTNLNKGKEVSKEKKTDIENINKVDNKNLATNLSKNVKDPSTADLKPVVENKPVVESKLPLDWDFKKFETELIQKPLTKDTLASVMDNISNYNKVTTNTPANKNGYAEVLLNHLIKNKNPDLLSKYITALKGDLTLLGSDKVTQNANYSKLLPQIDKNKPEYKDLLAVKFLINNQTSEDLSKSIKENLNQVIEQYGAMLLTAIEWVVGGKGKLAEFCKKWKLEQYFPTIEKFYETRYSLSVDQKAALQVPYDLQGQFVGGDKIVDNVICDKEKIQNYYSKDRLAIHKTEWNNKDNFHLLDPILVSRAIQDKDNKLTEFSNLIIPGDKKNGEQQYIFNDAVKLTLSQEQAIVGHMVTDQSLWTNISKLNDELRWESVYGKPNSNAAEVKTLSDENDVAMAFGACLMKGGKDLKYVISETKNLPNEADKRNKEESTVKQSEWKDLFVSKKNYPAAELMGNKLDADHQSEKDRIVAGMNKLFDKATHEDTISILNSDVSLTSESKTFIDSYLSVYLNTIIKDPKTKKEIVPKAQWLLDKKNSITKGFSLDMDSDKIVFSWKTADEKDVSFDSTSIIELISTSVAK